MLPFGILLTLFVIKIYDGRLEETKSQEKFQKMVSELSTRFLLVTALDVNKYVDDLLKQSGICIKADRAFVGMYTSDFKIVRYTHEWLGEISQSSWSKIGKEKSYETSTAPWSTKQLISNNIVHVTSKDILPP